MRSFAYVRATTVDETIRLLSENGNTETRLLAGGTDLLPLMKADIAAPTRLVDGKHLPGLAAGIQATNAGVTLGALTTLAQIETHPLLQQRYSALSEAAASAATPQLRNMATLGGNLLQRPRCWYFRNALVDCWLKGGDECQAYDGENQLHALFGDGPCYAVHPSDLPAALLALNAEVQVQGPGGDRTLPLRDFYALPTDGHRRETVLGADELILAVHLPTVAAGTRSTYLKAMDRKVWAFALVGVAACVRVEQNEIAEARLVLSGVAPIPWQASAAEAMLAGKPANAEIFAQAATIALADAKPLMHNAYKIPLAHSLIRRALALATAAGA